MKALLCTTHGLPDTLVLSDIPVPVPKKGEVLITVMACGVNYPDALIIQDKYQFKPPLPFAPGGEVAGIISAIGEGVTHLKPGDRVLTLSGWGGFAEMLVADARKVLPIPDQLDFVRAAAILYNYGTSYHALKDRACLQKGETLLVLGAAGGVGLAAVELGKKMGATVIAAASTDEKLALCKEKGADHLLNYSHGDFRQQLKNITGDAGVDVVYDPVGGALAEPALRSLAWKGRYLVVGFASGTIPQLPANLVLLKGSALLGVFWGSFAEKEPGNNLKNLQTLVQWVIAGAIDPHIHQQYPMAEAAQSIRDIMDRKVMGKAIVVPNESNTITTTPRTKKEGATADKPVPGMLVITGIRELDQHIGQTIGPGEWLTITQEMINDFAGTTRDFQWVHTDVERAAAQLPGGKTIAHGFFTLSLVSQFLYQLISLEGVSFFNYGINKARFITPVTVGSKLRLQATLQKTDKMDNGQVKLFLSCVVEKEGADKPACVVELISLLS